jgi:hypothetical protein
MHRDWLIQTLNLPTQEMRIRALEGVIESNEFIVPGRWLTYILDLPDAELRLRLLENVLNGPQSEGGNLLPSPYSGHKEFVFETHEEVIIWWLSPPRVKYVGTIHISYGEVLGSNRAVANSLYNKIEAIINRFDPLQ